MRALPPPAPTLRLLAVAAAAGALACAHAPAKMSFEEAGFAEIARTTHAMPEPREPEAAPPPAPVAVPVHETVALEVAEGPPIDATLVRFAAEARARRARSPASRGFPGEAHAAWLALAAELDRYLARPLPQTPLLEIVRARVTVDAEWEYDVRRYGAPPAQLAAIVSGRTARFARRYDTARALGFALFARTAPAKLRWPVAPAGISSLYGMRVHPVERQRRMHYGVDLAAAAGRVVSAAGEGWVVRAGWTSGYGLLVEVRHPGDLTTRYGHLSAILCAPGDPVEPGRALGLVGRTGVATGPHLHFEVWRGGEPSDPLPWLGLGATAGSAGR